MPGVTILISALGSPLLCLWSQSDRFLIVLTFISNLSVRRCGYETAEDKLILLQHAPPERAAEIVDSIDDTTCANARMPGLIVPFETIELARAGGGLGRRTINAFVNPFTSLAICEPEAFKYTTEIGTTHLLHALVMQGA